MLAQTPFLRPRVSSTTASKAKALPSAVATGGANSAATAAALAEAAAVVNSDDDDDDVSVIDSENDSEGDAEADAERAAAKAAATKARAAHAPWKSGVSDVITLLNAVRACAGAVDAGVAAGTPANVAFSKFCSENFLRTKVWRCASLL